ncbi:MAG: ATP-binding protein [Puniceicoccaceae bacterium]
MQILKHLCGLALTLSGVNCFAVETYTASIAPSLEENWRWTELEALSDMQYYFADEGSNGELWFAGISRTVARFDGSRLEYFPLEVDTPIVSILAASNGDVYTLTSRELYEFKAGEWERVLGQNLEPATYHRICEDSDGQIWVSASRGLYRLNDGAVDYFNTGSHGANALLVDSNGLLWVVEERSMEIVVYDIRNPGVGSLPVVHELDVSYSEQAPKLHMDQEGRVWIVSPNLSGALYYYQDYELHIGAVGLESLFNNSRAFQRSSGLEMASVSSGRNWVCATRALSEVEGSSVIPFTDNIRLPFRTPCFISLSGDRLLMGGLESKTYIIDMSPNRWVTYQGLNYQSKDKDGSEWFIEHDGRLVERDGTSDKWLAYGSNDGVIDRPNHVLCSRDGTVWVSGAHEGIAGVAYRTASGWRRMTFPEVGRIFSHLAVIESRDGSIILGSGTPTTQLGDSDGGGIVFNKVDGDWEARHVIPPQLPGRPAVIVERGKFESWFGGSFLYKKESTEQENLERVELFKSARWTDDIIVDSSDTLWVAAWGSGIFQVNQDGVNLYTEDKGLGSNEVIHLLYREANNDVLAATSMGLSFFDGNSWSNWTLPFEEPFSREGVTLREGEDGSLWINRAYRSWLLEGQIQDDLREQFIVYRFRNDKMGPETIIHTFQNELPEGSPVVASWSGQDMWSQTPVDQLEYSWRVGEGDWSPFTREDGTVLTGIKAGKHTFEVRARDADLNIDESPARIQIHMIPPLWKRAWFILIVIATILLIVFLLERLYKMRIRAAIAMEEFKLDFFTNISHELRNPLAVILGPLDSILNEDHSARTKSRIRLALRNARKMQGLVDQLLQFRKVELGKSTYRPAPGEIVGFIRDTVDLHEPLWVGKGVQMELKSSERSHVCSYDSDKLQKIVDNLVSNAIKYSEQHGRVSVSVEIEIEGGHQELVLVVEDQGRGIPIDKQELVMRPFYRVRKEKTKSSDEGFGIGLALVSGLVQVCGGEIDLMSPLPEGKQGTRFTVRLPLDEASPSDIAEVAEAEVEPIDPVEVSKHGNDARVLLVEDNSDLRSFIREELSDRYAILEADNGREGMEVALRENPELIVTDVMMPELDGMEFCRQLRSHEETSHVPIIMLTAKSSEKHSIEGMEAGADVFFPKPVNMVKLVAQIENLLELRANMKKRFSEQLVVEPTELEIAPAEQQMLQKAIEVVESNMSDPEFDVDQFAREMGMGRTALLKKLKALTGEAPGSFIRSMRLKRAAQLLSTETITVSETLDYIGILDASYFSRVFKKQFGVAPSQYAKGDSGH